MHTITAPIASAGAASIHDLFAARAPCHPLRTAVVEGERAVDYATLAARTDALAGLLNAGGVVAGDRVAVLARNCMEYVEAQLACARLGAIVAAQNWRLATPELDHCLTLVAPSFVLAQAGLADRLDDTGARDLPRLVFGPDYETALRHAPPPPPPVSVGPEAGHIILYTSGTTGLPKGALVSHRAMVARASVFASELSIPPGDAMIAWAPMYHMASTDHMLATLMRGGTVHVVDGYDRDRLADLLARVATRYLIAMPGMVGDFAERMAGRQVAGVGIAGAMADLVPGEEIAALTRALDAPYLNSFGSTETGFPPASGSVLPVGCVPERLSKVQSTFCDVVLVDADDRPVAHGQPGEVAVRGPTVFSGYWGADETNAHDFRGGRFHMGDVMRRNADGTLDYVDRVKFMIKTGGENVYPAEIERVLATHPAVSEAAVTKRSDPRWGEVPVAFVVARAPVEADTLIAHCRSSLAGYKLPKDIRFIEADAMPRSTTGKVQRHRLQERLEETP